MPSKISLRAALFGITVIAIVLAYFGDAFRPAPPSIPVFSGYYGDESFYCCGKNYKIDITKDAIAQSPIWDRRRANPPLSANAALVAADQLRMRWLKDRKIPEHWDEKDAVWEVLSIQLCPADSKHWYWLITFDFGRFQINGARNEFVVPVLMDGTVIEPKLIPEDSENTAP